MLQTSPAAVHETVSTDRVLLQITRRMQCWEIVWVLMLLINVGWTFPIWWGTANTDTTYFPMIPLWSGLSSWPLWVDRVLVGLWIVALFIFGIRNLMTWSTQSSLIFHKLFVVILGMLFILNQHRLQPWAWQAWVISLMFNIHCLYNSTPSLQPLAWMTILRWLTISIYLFSGISKLDVNFMDGIGLRLFHDLQHLLPTVWQTTLETMSLHNRNWIIFSFPCGELLVAVLLMMNWSRTCGLYLSIAMHTMLIVMFGPWNAEQELPVLSWNLYFILQNLLIFRNLPTTELNNETLRYIRQESVWNLPARLGGINVLILLLPVLEWGGLYDVWQSWGVYSERQSKVVMQINEAQHTHFKTGHVPLPMQENSWGQYSIPLQTWSLQTTGAPLYTGRAFRVGVARGMIEHYSMNTFDLRILEPGSCMVRDGNYWAHPQADFHEVSELDHYARGEWFNTQPRTFTKQATR
jgi:hypothetical protein